MMFATLMNNRPLWYPADEGGDPPAGDPPAGNPPAGDPPAGDPPAGSGDAWWEADAYKPASEWLGKKGLLVEDQGEVLGKAIEGWRNAEKRLGQPAESLIAKPEEGQSVSEWMRANAEVFALPDKPDGYELPDPELPEGMAVDPDLIEGARQIAFEEAIPPAALERFQSLYAERMSNLVSNSQEQYKRANDEMMAELSNDWGDSTAGKISQAQQAAKMVAEKAGIDDDTFLGVAQTLTEKVGDAGVIRMFAAIADMSGEDVLAGAGAGGPLTTTPVEAKARKVQIMAPDGEYAAARKAGNKEKMADIEKELARLNKIIAG